MNTGIGALSFDVTHSRLKSDAHDDSGQSYRATFNRMFTDTQTSIVLAAYRYSTKGYYNLNDALYAVDQEKNSRSNYTLWRRQKNGMTFTVNQNLPDGWGGFYLSGRISDYWNRSGTEKQYQVSYNNSFGRLSRSASAQRVYTPDSSGHRRDDRISLNFSYPLWFGDNRTANLTSNTSFNNSRFASSQIGINGSLDSENNLNYGVSTTTATGGQHDVALNGSYRTPWTTLNGSYSQGEGYRQSGIGASGTMIAHSGGVVLSPESGSTMALIEAKDAAGAMLPGSPGTRVDSNGYAILPYLRPYRINAVEIDPKGSHDDVAFDRTVAQVVPWEGSVVKVAFGTKVQNNLTLQARQANHEPLPFAASIFSPDGKEIGVVGRGSMMFISDANAKRAIVKWSGGQCSVDLGDSKQQRIAYVAEEITNAFYRLNGAGNHLVPGLYASLIANGDAGHGGGQGGGAPDLPVGSVILTRDWTMSAPGGASYRCTSGTNRFAAKIVSPGATDLGNKIYSTNVPGIGMRFSRGGATVNIVYPDVFSSRILHHQLFPRRVALTLEIIKTAATTGSGTGRRVSTPPTTGRAAITRSSKPI